MKGPSGSERENKQFQEIPLKDVGRTVRVQVEEKVEEVVGAACFRSKEKSDPISKPRMLERKKTSRYVKRASAFLNQAFMSSYRIGFSTIFDMEYATDDRCRYVRNGTSGHDD